MATEIIATTGDSGKSAVHHREKMDRLTGDPFHNLETTTDFLLTETVFFFSLSSILTDHTHNG